jgi:DNA-binding NarL/FixJ family response regulator
VIRALVADDSDLVRKYVRTLLEFQNDIEVCAEAVDGREAVSMAVQSKPDLIILDLTMPVMDGFAAAIELRQLMPEVPILFFSIHESSEFVKRAKDIGARGYLSKEQMSGLRDAVDALVFHNKTYFSKFANDHSH